MLPTDLPIDLPTALFKQLMAEGAKFDGDVVPHLCAADFVNTVAITAGVLEMATWPCPCPRSRSSGARAARGFRTAAGVHFESDNLAGLQSGQEAIEAWLPGCLVEDAGADPDAVRAKIVQVRNDWTAHPTLDRR